MQVLRLKKKTKSKTELANLTLTMYCLLSGIKVSNTELDVLSYFAVYGFKKSTKDMIIRSQILNSHNSLENTITKLRKAQLLDRDREGQTIMRKDLQFTVENRLGIIIRLDNI